MFELFPTNSFKRDMRKQPIDLTVSVEWIEVMDCLMNGKIMAKKYCDHDLKNDWKGFRECHIRPDLLLIYETDSRSTVIQLVRIGSHSELFGHKRY